MKRNENLKTLSWEHHDGLVVSFRLQQGLKKNANTTEMVEYILHTWKNILEHHFWLEEQSFVQTLIKSKEASNLISQMINDHEQFKILISRLKEDDKNKKIIEEFANLLNKHIRFEERQLFPLIEKELGSNKLDEVGKFLKQHHNPSCEVWQNQFWKN
jgi:hemerythrin-like domain-containing protein